MQTPISGVTEKPNWKQEVQAEYSRIFNVWAEIFDGNNVGPFIIEGNLNKNLLIMARLVNQILPDVQNIVIKLQ